MKKRIENFNTPYRSLEVAVVEDCAGFTEVMTHGRFKAFNPLHERFIERQGRFDFNRKKFSAFF